MQVAYQVILVKFFHLQVIYNVVYDFSMVVDGSTVQNIESFLKQRNNFFLLNQAGRCLRIYNANQIHLEPYLKMESHSVKDTV